MKRIANLYVAELRPSREWLTLRRLLAINVSLLVVFAVAWVVAQVVVSQQQSTSIELGNTTTAVEAQLQQRQSELDNALNDPELNNALAETQQVFVLRQRLLEQMQQFTQQNQQNYSQLLIDLAAADQEAIWLQRIYVNDNALSLEGHTLQPQQLPSWLASFSGYTSLQQRPFGVFELRDEGEQGLRFVVGHTQDSRIMSSTAGGSNP
jgi:Tfp pilus assembly protein PilN